MEQYTPANPRITTCDPVPGYAPVIGRYVAQLEELRADLLGELSSLTQAQLDWHPNDKVESIGTMLLHMDAVEWSWIHEDILGRPDNEYPGEWSEAMPIRVNAEQVSGRPLQWYLDKLEATRAVTLDVLKGFSESDVARRVGEGPVPKGEEKGSRLFTIDWIIWHIISHEAAHIGQIELLRRLQQA